MHRLVLLSGLGLAVAVLATAGPVDRPAPVAPPPRPVAVPLTTAPRPVEPLPKGAVARMGSRLFRHPAGHHSVRFALGGKLLVAHGRDCVAVWDAGTGQTLRVIGPRPGEARLGDWVVRGVGLRADGRTLFVHAGEPRPLHEFADRSFLWDLERDAEIGPARMTLTHGSGGPNLFVPDGSAMAQVGDRGVALWDGDGKPTGGVGDAPPPWLNTAAFAPDGKLVYLVREDQTISVWDVAGREKVRAFGGKLPKSWATALSPDGRHLATFSRNPPDNDRPWAQTAESVRVWDPAAGKLLAEFPWGPHDPDGLLHQSVGFLADGSLWAVVTTFPGLTFRRWDRATGAVVQEWTAPLAGREVVDVAVTDNGDRMAAASSAGFTRILDGATGADLTPGPGHRAGVVDLRFTPDGRRLVTAGDDDTVRTWDAATGDELCRLGGVGAWPHLSPDGGTVFATTLAPGVLRRDGAVTARDKATGREVWRTPGFYAAVPDPSGKAAVAVEAYHSVPAAVLDAATGRVLRPFPTNDPPLGFGRGSAVYAVQKRLTVWELATGTATASWDAKEAGLCRTRESATSSRDPDDLLTGAALSPDGARMAVVVSRNSTRPEGERAVLFLCQAATGRVVWRSKLDSCLERAVAFSPDGRYVAVAGDGVKLLDAATGEVSATLDGHPAACVFAFSPDGTRLATGGRDGIVFVWELRRK